jgi:hypothetical protein
MVMLRVPKFGNKISQTLMARSLQERILLVLVLMKEQHSIFGLAEFITPGHNVIWLTKHAEAGTPLILRNNPVLGPP